MGGITRGALTERFYRKTGLATRALVGSERLRQACDSLKLQGREVLEIYYEDLAASPSKTMQEVCEFLEVPFEPRMASLDGADRSVVAGVESQHHAGLWCDRIAVQREKDELIAPATRRKIARYVCRWKSRYQSGWLEPCLHNLEAGRSPGRVELWCDRVTYRSLTLWDEMVKVIYALAPLVVARSFRSWLDNRALAGTSASGESESVAITPVFEETSDVRSA
jgi:hypothetical protein